MVWQPPNEGAEVVWKHEKTELVDGESMSGTNRVLLDHLPTSLETSEEMDSSSEGRYNDLISFLEVQRIPDKSAHCLDLKDMSSYDNFVGPSTRNLPHVVCTRYFYSAVGLNNYRRLKKKICVQIDKIYLAVGNSLLAEDQRPPLPLNKVLCLNCYLEKCHKTQKCRIIAFKTERRWII